MIIMLCKNLPPLLKEKQRDQNKWSMANVTNYTNVLKDERTALAMWHDLISYKFPEKELRESFDFVHRIRSSIRSKNVLELFCGHGLIGQILLKYHLVKYVWQMDQLWSKNRDLVYSLYNKTNLYPIVDKITDDMANDHNVGLVYSMHGCGAMTDITIDFAIKHKIDVMVCPCCYHLAKAPHNVFGSYNIDQFRIAKLLLNGYKVNIKTMHQSISPMNRIIIGLL